MTKKIRNYALIALLSIVAAGFAAGSAFAWSDNDDMRGPGGWHEGGSSMGMHKSEKFGNYLISKGVSADMVTKYRNDWDKFRTENEGVFNNISAKRLQLREELSKENPDAKKAKAVQAEIDKLRNDLNAKRIDQMIYMKKTYPQISELTKQAVDNHEFGKLDGKGINKGPGNNAGPRK